MEDKKWVDITSEEFRVYSFASEGGTLQVTIDEPVKLHVSENGHRILSKDGLSHYVPNGWYHLYWRAKAGEPAFVL